MATRPTLPTFDLPTLSLPTLPAVDEKVVAAVRDAAYITVGLGVLAVQQAEARRSELVQAIADRFDANKAQVEELLGTVETRLRKVDEQVKRYAEQATTQLRGLVRNAA